MDKPEKIYCGNGKVIETKSGFSFLSFKLSPEDLKTITERAGANDGWCTLNIMSRKEPSAKGNTHYGTVDQYVPKSKDAKEDLSSVPF